MKDKERKLDKERIWRIRKGYEGYEEYGKDMKDKGKKWRLRKGYEG